MLSGGKLTARPALRLAVCMPLLGATLHCAAATLTVKVVDERGHPVESVAVYAVPTEQPAVASAPDAKVEPRTAIMDQADNAFVPHVLVVQTGTAVLFPNNDSVSHHVYSFSGTKIFELGLYKGDAHPPLRFETPGVVVLGCNIHDGMLGYIVVVDTPHFSLTGRSGSAQIDGLAAGEYTVEIWTPRSRPNSLPSGSRVTVSSAHSATMAFELVGKLLPQHEHSNTALSWERY